MTGPKLLIDTNILIGLEDNQEVASVFSELHQKCALHGVQIFIHEASKQDIKRDKDLNRQSIILSKVEKFPELNDIPIPDKWQLEQTYGPIRKPNDHVDVILLHTLAHVGAVDFLVTQDRGLHKRAAKIGISNCVFRVEDALVWLRALYDNIQVELPYIEEKRCHQIDTKDGIFVSLQTDYSGFNTWFKKSCILNHRYCWTINFNNEIAGIAIRKDESFDDLTREVTGVEERFSTPPKKF